MKKITKALSLILVLALFALMAIGSGSSKSDDVQPPSSATTGGEEATTKPADSSTPSNNSSNDSSSTPSSTPSVTIDEAVIFEQEGIKITAKSFDSKGTFGPEIKLLIENDSDKNVTVQSRSTSVNGYMVDTMMSADVVAGKKANNSLTFMTSDLETADITTIADMEFSFHIFDSETWDTIVDSDIISIKTSAADGFAYSFDDSGTHVYNENNVEIVVKGLSEDASWVGPSIVVYIYNSGNDDIAVQARDVSINGFMVDTIFSCEVMPNKHAIDTISFMSSDLEENGIEKIENVELTFHVFDYSSFDTIADTSPVTISFS